MSATRVEREIGHAELPAVIDRYVVAHNAKNVDTAIASFTTDAVVTDNGLTHRRLQNIKAWLGTSSTEWTYTSTPTVFRKTDDAHYVVVQHVVGDFPGGVVDLRYRFTMAGDLVAELVIAP